MRKFSAVFSFALLSSSLVFADEGFDPAQDSLVQQDLEITQAPAPVPMAKPAPVKKIDSFKSFTGKVKGKKVRLRASADTESTVIRELQLGELVSVVEDKGDFWGVTPGAESKAYVFRSFVLDNTVEGTHVNVRLKPNLEAPVIAHLNTGDRVEGSVCQDNSKWMEIKAPETARFYVAKEYIENVGNPEMKSHFEKRATHARKMLEASISLAKTELKKSYDRIEQEKVLSPLKGLMEEFADMPEIAHTAQTELNLLQEALLQKRISYLEDKANGIEPKDESVAASDTVTDKMRMWEPVEEALYLSWSSLNEDKNLEQYYEEQKLNAVALTGTLEVYDSPSRTKPGDYILKDQNQTRACIYSTKVDLQKFIGKRVTVYGVERPNNHFAFPAFYVVEAE